MLQKQTRQFIQIEIEGTLVKVFSLQLDSISLIQLNIVINGRECRLFNSNWHEVNRLTFWKT